jgi:hypothetical protein
MNYVKDTLENEEFQERFCRNCKEMLEEYGFTDCVAGLDPSDSNCVRRSAWLEIRGRARTLELDVDDILSEFQGQDREAVAV